AIAVGAKRRAAACSACGTANGAEAIITNTRYGDLTRFHKPGWLIGCVKFRFFGDFSGMTSEHEVLKAWLRCPKSSGTCGRPRKQPAAELDRRRAASTFGASQAGLLLGELHLCRARF